MGAVLGCITVGQAPRSDVIPDLAAVLGPGVKIVEAGALDGLTLKAVTALAPRPGQSPLASRMADGTGVSLGKENLLDRLQGCVDRVVAEGATGILLLCTGKFPVFRSPVPIYQPGQLLKGATLGLIPPGTRLGVLCPLAEQLPLAAQKWGGYERTIVAAHASPYHGDEQLLAGARDLVKLDPEMILMDCMGYRVAHRALMSRLFAGRPVILANTAAVRLLAEVI